MTISSILYTMTRERNAAQFQQHLSELEATLKGPLDISLRDRIAAVFTMAASHLQDLFPLDRQQRAVYDRLIKKIQELPESEGALKAISSVIDRYLEAGSPLLDLPPEVRQYFIEMLSDKDKASVAQTAAILSADINEIMKHKLIPQMEGLLALADDVQKQILTDEIQIQNRMFQSVKLSLFINPNERPVRYLPTQIEREAWVTKLATYREKIEQNRVSGNDLREARKLLSLWRMDLLEALSELNIDGRFIDCGGEVLRACGTAPDDSGDSQWINRVILSDEIKARPELVALFNEAKTVLKGQVCIMPGPAVYAPTALTNFIVPPSGTEDPNGPYVNVIVSNDEFSFWNSNYYRTPNIRKYFHASLFGRAQEGDRIVLPIGFIGNTETIILRLRQYPLTFAYRYGPLLGLPGLPLTSFQQALKQAIEISLDLPHDHPVIQKVLANLAPRPSVPPTLYSDEEAAMRRFRY